MTRRKGSRYAGYDGVQRNEFMLTESRAANRRLLKKKLRPEFDWR